MSSVPHTHNKLQVLKCKINIFFFKFYYRFLLPKKGYNLIHTWSILQFNYMCICNKDEFINLISVWRLLGCSISLRLVIAGRFAEYFRQHIRRWCTVIFSSGHASHIGGSWFSRIYLWVSWVWPRYSLMIAEVRSLFFRAALNIMSVQLSGSCFTSVNALGYCIFKNK